MIDRISPPSLASQVPTRVIRSLIYRPFPLSIVDWLVISQLLRIKYYSQKQGCNMKLCKVHRESQTQEMFPLQCLISKGRWNHTQAYGSVSMIDRGHFLIIHLVPSLMIEKDVTLKLYWKCMYEILTMKPLKITHICHAYPVM